MLVREERVGFPEDLGFRYLAEHKSHFHQAAGLTSLTGGMCHSGALNSMLFLTGGKMKKSVMILIGVLGFVGLLSAQSVEQPMSEGMTALNEGNYELAVLKFRNVISREPDNFEAQFNLALSYLRWDKPSNAVQEFNKAIRIAEAKIIETE